MAFTIPSEKIYDIQNQKIKENFIDKIDVTSKDEQFQVVNDELKIDEVSYTRSTGSWSAGRFSNFKGGISSNNTSGNFNYVFGTNSLYTSDLEIPFYCVFTLISKQSYVRYIELTVPKNQGLSIIQDLYETDFEYTLQGTVTSGKRKDTDVRVCFTYGDIGDKKFSSPYAAVINYADLSSSTADITGTISNFFSTTIPNRLPLSRPPTEDVITYYDTYNFSPQIEHEHTYYKNSDTYVDTMDVNEGQDTEKISVINQISRSDTTSKNGNIQANYTWEETDPHSTINNRLPNNTYAQKIEYDEDKEVYKITFALEVSYGVEILPFKLLINDLNKLGSSGDNYKVEATSGGVNYIYGYLKKTETSYLYKWVCDTADITVNGKVIKLNLSDKTATFGDGTQYTFSVTSNDFLKTSTTINGENFINKQYSSLQTQYANGKETAVIRCAVGGYTDGENDKVLFDLYDEVVPMKYTNTGDKPMSLDSKGNAKVFKVLGTELKYDGGLYQILHLQEK